MSRPYIKITLVVPKLDDPTSFYRAAGPLHELRLKVQGRQVPVVIDFLMPSNYSWATIGMSDIVFMQRPADPNCLQIANIAKMERVPLWIDFDDDNLSVPEDNETHDFFNQWQIKDTITKVARMADVISVSTEFLKKRYKPYNDNIHVVPNAISEKYFWMRRDLMPKRPRDKVIAWRGGPGYWSNIEEVADSLVSVANRNTAYKFIFMGRKPYQILSKISNSQHIPWLENFMDYMGAIFHVHATSFWYCVKPNHHSLSRSHGAWLEATFSGAGMLAKNIPEFNRPGCINFDDAKQFVEKLEAILRKDINITKHVEESWAYISDNYLLRKVNQKRLEIVESLLDRGNPYEQVAA